MNDMSPVAGTHQRTALDKAHIWRSKFLDQVSKCEAELRLIHIKTHPAAKTPSLKTMTEVFCGANQLGGGQNKQLAKICQSLMPLIELRASAAHSEIGIAAINDQHFVTLANANGRMKHGRHLLLLTEDEQRLAQIEIASIANQLSQLRVALKA